MFGGSGTQKKIPFALDVMVNHSNDLLQWLDLFGFILFIRCSISTIAHKGSYRNSLYSLGTAHLILEPSPTLQILIAASYLKFRSFLDLLPPLIIF